MCSTAIRADGIAMAGRILGIDPGIALLGYGLIAEDGDSLFPIHYGCISTPATDSTSERLRSLYWGLIGVIEAHRPTDVAIELFVARNLKTALAVGQARGVAVLAAANCHLPVYDYTPAEVKQRVAGFGRGDKSQVQEMVRLQLGLDQVPRPDDAADALAIAICHATRNRVDRIMARGG